MRHLRPVVTAPRTDRRLAAAGLGAPAAALHPAGAGAGRLQTLIARAGLIGGHAVTTAAEILLGMGLGTALGMAAGAALAASRGARQWLLPMLVSSQALPIFALAPLLVLWLGYGMASKVAVAVLVIFFPVTAAFFDGLRRTEAGWLELAQTMNADARRGAGPDPRAGGPAGAWPPACGWRRRWRRSAPSSASGSARPPASAT